MRYVTTSAKRKAQRNQGNSGKSAVGLENLAKFKFHVGKPEQFWPGDVCYPPGHRKLTRAQPKGFYSFSAGFTTLTTS